MDKTGGFDKVLMHVRQRGRYKPLGKIITFPVTRGICESVRCRHKDVTWELQCRPCQNFLTRLEEKVAKQEKMKKVEIEEGL